MKATEKQVNLLVQKGWDKEKAEGLDIKVASEAISALLGKPESDVSPQKSSNGGKFDTCTMYTSYAKDVFCATIEYMDCFVLSVCT